MVKKNLIEKFFMGFAPEKLKFMIAAMIALLLVLPSFACSQRSQDASWNIKPAPEHFKDNNDSSSSAQTKIHALPVKMHPQETENWCWAACGQMVMEYLGRNISQCEQANNRYNRRECCGPSLNSQLNGLSKDDSTLLAYLNCARSGWPEFAKYNFYFKRTTSAALTWDELKAQLSPGPKSKGKPVAFSWRWKRGGGHMMVAKGYTSIDGQNYVIVLDPWPAKKGDVVIIPYSAYVEDPGNYSHWDDFYDIMMTRDN